jgi:predicted TIM-barrel fold metal-dependent hydrolase
MRAPNEEGWPHVKPFIFSCDSHINEPKTLWLDALPAALKDKALRTRKDEKYFYVDGNGQTLMRMQVDDGVSGNEKIGRYDVNSRLKDMALDGIDAEIIFPTMGLLMSRLEDRDLEVASCQIYNDWLLKHFAAHLETFVPAAILPVADVSEAVAELKRCIALGYTASMIPAGLPKTTPSYNKADWDPLWELACEHNHPFIVHAGTGVSTVSERGPGAALINYMYSGRAAIDCVAYLVAGGGLDRFPKLRIATMEAGASFLNQLAEILDEIYPAHLHYVRPRLSRKPSEIISQQVCAAFSHDRSAVAMRHFLGHQTLMFASDYPHLEGSFPHTREAVEENFRDLNVPDNEIRDILGRTAAKLFGLKNAKAFEEAA